LSVRRSGRAAEVETLCCTAQATRAASSRSDGCSWLTKSAWAVVLIVMVITS
jgi:hypothetical protein